MDKSLDEQLAYEEVQRAIRELFNEKLKALGLANRDPDSFNETELRIYDDIRPQIRLEISQFILELE